MINVYAHVYLQNPGQDCFSDILSGLYFVKGKCLVLWLRL